MNWLFLNEFMKDIMNIPRLYIGSRLKSEPNGIPGTGKGGRDERASWWDLKLGIRYLIYASLV